MLFFRKPQTMWYPDIFEPEGIHNIISVQMFYSRVVSLLTKIDDETVSIVLNSYSTLFCCEIV